MSRPVRRRFAGIPDEFWIGFIIMVGLFLKLYYDMELPYDAGTIRAGVWEPMKEGLPGGGHIGMMQYYFEMRRLPDFDPRKVMCASNPPLYYISCAVFLHLTHRLMRWPIGTALHVIKCVNVFFVMTGEAVAIGILHRFGVRGRKLVVGILFLIFFPPFYHLSASLDGSAAAFMLMMVSIGSVLSWFGSRRFAALRMTAVSLGLAMMISYRSAMVIPGILILLIHAKKDGRRNQTPLKRQYPFCAAQFLVLTLLWPVYLLIRFHVPPFYTEMPNGGEIHISLLKRLLPIPKLFLVRLQSTGNASIEYNIWAQTFKTAILDFHAVNMGGAGTRFICGLAILISAAVCILAHAGFIYIMFSGRIDRVLCRFLRVGYGGMLAGYLLACFLFPVTGTMRFLYITQILIFPVTGLSLCGTGGESDNLFEKTVTFMADGLVLILALLTAFLYGFCL
ncbi:MAG: hypothetical protein IJJ52_04955 [Lachnospiraceae bacterium]|nr:hypothetical protein [Lachnospiraceae bacterium]